MFILIFVNLRQINVTYSYGLIYGLIFTFKVNYDQKYKMINHIPIKQVWLEKKIVLIKDVQKWVDKKLLKNPMNFLIYNISMNLSLKRK
jgi:hypothetical protein